LEEHDLPEEADVQRAWTKEKQLEFDCAEELLQDFVAKVGSSRHDGLGIDTYEGLLAYMEEAKEEGFHMFVGDQEYLQYKISPNALWKAWETVTGKEATEEAKESSWYSCAC